MESTDTPRSALDEIKTVAFKQGIRGYVVDEVDEFLDRAAAEVDQIREQMHQMRQQLRQAGERIRQLEGGASVPAPAPAPAPATAPAPVVAPAPVPAPTLAPVGAEQVTAMIAMAQQFIDQAQQEAEARAREMTVAAQERAREIVAEARSRAEDEVTRLNGLKQRLSEDVATLTHQLDTERTRVTTVLAELSQWIESNLHVGAPATPAASSPAPAATAPSAPPMTADSATRPLAPPPAPPASMGTVLNFDSPTDNRA
jgi:cell division initiation protein